MSSTAFPIDTAQIVALFMQSILYGIVLVTVTYGLRVLLWSRDGRLKSKQSVNWIMVVVTVAMFTIATLEMGFGLQHVLEAFIYFKGSGGAKEEFADISNWVNVMRTADYVAQTFIGDGIMLYRCYVVCDRSWKIVVLPALLWLAETACGWVVVYIEATLHTDAFLNQSRLVPFITSVLSLTLAMTTISTGLIVYHIMRINGQVASQNMTVVGGGSRKLTRVIRILVESGLIYTASVIVFFGTFLASNNAQYGVSDCVVQLIPISFTLILIRVDQGVAVQSSTVQWNSTIQAPITLKNMPSTNNNSRAGHSNLSISRSGGTYTADDMTSDGWKGGDPIV